MTETICAKCKNKISNTVQDNHGKGWLFANDRICNSCYVEIMPK